MHFRSFMSKLATIPAGAVAAAATKGAPSLPLSAATSSLTDRGNNLGGGRECSSGVAIDQTLMHHQLIKDGWFNEMNTMWPGQRFCIEIEEVLYSGKSKFQDILVFKSKTYGNVLVLDGVIQVTERDEFSYQEMISHIPLFAAKGADGSGPKKVLIVGGGDGGVLREVVKHPGVQEIHMCEIDEQVVEVGKKFFAKTMATAFSDPRVKLIIDDAARFLREEGPGQQYDVIICDSSDPVGPADVLFQPAFFQSMHNSLSPTGVICTQGECQWLHLDLIASVMGEVRKIFNASEKSVKYAYTTMPTYPSGQIGFIVATKDPTLDVSVPSRPLPGDLELQYYSSAVHSAAFVLPAFTARKLGL